MVNFISFIVPAFNCEAYIEQCVFSILNQDFERFEVIVIDDGSTDGTGLILDKLSEVYDNLIVIHNQNSGVSVSRNVGLARASGDYVAFVDGDDFLAPGFAKYMSSLIGKSGADFAISINCFESVNDNQPKKNYIKKMSKEEITELLLLPIVKVGCWNKIYKKSFLLENNLLFDSKLFYGEGLDFIVRVSQRCNFAMVGNRRVYYYRRNNETSVCTVFKIENVYNGELSLNTIKNNLIVSNKTFLDAITIHLCLFYAGALTRIRINKMLKQYKTDNKKWLSFNRKHLGVVLFSKQIGLYYKLIILLSAVCPSFLSILEKKRRKRIQKNSVEKI